MFLLSASRFLLLGLLLGLALPATLEAQYYYTTNNGAITIAGYSGPGGSVSIPDTINGLPVAAIGDDAFEYCAGLARITIPNGVASIGNAAFAGCISLTNVTIPNSVASIGDDAFSYCASLAGVAIPNGVASIGVGAFSDCASLTNVTIPNNVASIGDEAFSHCTSLANVTIPKSVTSIGIYAFGSCGSLEGVYFQGNAPGVGADAFYDDNNATVYYLPGTTGWGPAFGGRPAMLLNSQPVVTVQIVGTGTVSPDYNGQSLQVGQTYSMTANPGTGFLFAGWSGSVVTNTATLHFVMQSNMVLVANFLTNLLPAASGTYHGLFADDSGSLSPQNCGSFTLVSTPKGAFTGSLQTAGTSYALGGQFDPAGAASDTVARPNMSALTVNLQLDLTNGTDRVTGSVTDGTWTATLAGDRAIYDGKTKLAPQAGSYTLILPGAHGSTNEPAGDSYGALTVAENGAISFTGTLADGTKVTPSAPVSKYGQWPLYASLYGGQGVLWGWLSFTNASVLGGPIAWTKLPLKTQYYPAGFSLTAQALGTRYFPPATETNVLGLTTSTNLTLTLEGGGLAKGITNLITLAVNSHVTPLSGPKLSLTLTPSTGGFAGSVVNPATSKPVSFGGVLLQGRKFGSGFFLGADGSGEVRLEP
jgi:hypothetical protein